MAYLGADFERDFANVSPDEGFTLIDPGTYQLEIIKADLCNTKDGFGKYIKTQIKVLGPKFQGRNVFKNFNVQNASPEAERIGKSQLKSLTVACNIRGLSDTDQLVGIPFIADISVQKGRNGYNDQNDVKNFKTLGNVPSTGAKSATRSYNSPQEAQQPSAPTNARSFADAFGGKDNTPPPPQAPADNSGSSSPWNYDKSAF